MTVLPKPVADLVASDLAALLSDGTPENILLEYKTEVPSKDEFLKKVTAFANTYGGHVVIGASAPSSDARLVALPGVTPEPGFRQRVVQWAYDGADPPVEVFVSDGIRMQDGVDSVCYVIHVPMSGTGPHFIAGRKGCYIRTDEFSQRFEPRLATYSEIQHLQNRRHVAEERRAALLARARARFDRFVGAEYGSFPGVSGPIGATLMLAIAPAYPTRQLIQAEQLRIAARDLQIPWRQTGFPIRIGDRCEPVTQLDSVLRIQPGGYFSLLELSVWGQLFFAIEIEQELKLKDDKNTVNGMHLNGLIGHVLAFLQYARVIYKCMPYDGPLVASLGLVRVLGKPFIYFFPYHSPALGPASRLDDEIEIELPFSSSQVRNDPDGVAMRILQELFFALNWADQASDSAALDAHIKNGYEYNMWPPPPARS